MTSTSVTWSKLESSLNGSLIENGDPGFGESTEIYNGAITAQPAAVANCRSVDDVRRVVDFAREEGIELSVKCGGHNIAGLASTNGGLMLNLRDINSAAVDVQTQTVRVGGGATWAEFDLATTAHNLATTGGAISSTGIGGLTLGGGVGNIGRAHGLSCDNLIGAQVVLANGDVVNASDALNQDLFWALRGGGGNFGVVTEFRYRLHPTNGVYGGLIIHPRPAAAGALRQFREVMTGAPNDLNAYCAILSSPDGDPIVVHLPWYNGSEAEAASSVAPFKSWGEPIADLTAQVPYTACQTTLDAGLPFGLSNYWKSHFLTGLPDEAIDVIVDYSNRAPSPLTITLLETLGGAYAAVGNDDTAFDHRDDPFNLVIITRWVDPADADANIAWTREYFDALKPWSAGVYVNYLSQGDAPSRVKEVYSPGKYDRLVDVKRKYDPGNLFRRNQNIKP